MFTSVRKPPLSPRNNAPKSDTSPRGVQDVVEAPNAPGSENISVMPAVTKAVTCGNTSSRGNDAFGYSSQRQGAVVYHTTKSLFSGSTVQPKLNGSGNRVERGHNNNDQVPVENGSTTTGGVVALPHPHSLCGSPKRRALSKGNTKRNASDNMAAILGCSVLGNVEGMGGTSSNQPRRAFSGPPSQRGPPSQGSEDLLQRPHPPGSGGSKSGIRQLQFALNANSSQRLTPMPPRLIGPFNQSRHPADTAAMALRNGNVVRKRVPVNQHDSVDPFATTQLLNGLSAQVGSLSDNCMDGGQPPLGAGSRWGKSASSHPLAVASVKLQQLSSAGRQILPRTPVEMTGVSPRNANLCNSMDDNKNANSTAVGGDGKGTLNYDFRVVASTGKCVSLPIKLSVGVGCLQGHRPTMEDEHFVRIHAATAAGQPVSLLGILDGHCGRRVAELAAKHVPDNFIAHSALGENNALAFVESIIQADRAIFHCLGKGPGNAGFGVGANSSGGSTLIAAAVHGRMLYVACLGDARAVLYDGNMTIPMSEDHKPTNKKEHTRILQCGGYVQFGRVCGVLAVSRALGDYEFKFSGNRFIANRELMVSNVADVRQINLTNSSKFLLMACDGLWDVVENEEATQFVRDFLRYTPDVGSSPEATKRALNNCCQKLAEFAIGRGSTDNVSVMLLFFHNVADVVAGFDRPSEATAPPTPHTSNISPRLSLASRGLSISTSSIDMNGSGHGKVTPASGITRPVPTTGAIWLNRSRSSR
ncbi:putative Protein phosphatase 2C [Trypanosoma vivax]|uniref:PPM-type phosphatase domain-containing protein n=1 Tax=Trypanosoma vivax (strain Y486) TaxID=1055687 RepID=G0TYM2_TRYVY|nr:putative protein phosphatase 2C [Trypanosoma vivax]KAH8611353.1 putative Protein phosphatase 2C [Trypanosoma vivax]CCC49069.1 putative protein phosphatase 2C [Trypanosoma vivax Y486]